ncbi:MAG: NADH-quinone oxidoreductase subunit C [Acidimicrobiia bacterium]|nr:NADH-quinone oxidoreductase subunit C [Acidimicrobiia bacterium]
MAPRRGGRTRAPRLRLSLLRFGGRLGAHAPRRWRRTLRSRPTPGDDPGVAGGAGRFQAFAHVESTSRKWGVTFKTDVAEDEPRVQSWAEVYSGADWHERECWEMYGFVFDGHPSLRPLYLPAEFEGHPLRKDFPLTARKVKPWPGLVDVEAMPEDTEPEDTGEEGGDA